MILGGPVVTSEVRAEPSGSTDGRPPSVRSVWVTAGAVLVAAVLALVVALAERPRTHGLVPYFGPSTQRGRLAVGATFYVQGDFQPQGYKSGHHLVDLRSVTPRIVVNTSHANVRVMECAVADPHLGIGVSGPASARPICARLHPFRPGVVDLGFPATEVIYIVTPTMPGTLRIDGADVAYTEDGDAVLQHAGSRIALTTDSDAK